MGSAPSSTRVAVLLAIDQRCGRAPDHCVKSGVRTTDAIQVTAFDLPGASWWQLLAGSAVARLVAVMLRRPRLAVAICVSARVWGIWRFRVGSAVVAGSVGVGIAVGGLVGRHPALAVFGAIVFALSWLWRVWSAWRWWFGLRYRAGREHVLVHRASAAFDADSRRLFTDAQTRRR